MTSDVLTQQEVESLLGGNHAGGEQVAPYDFRQSQRLGKAQLRAIEAVHENLARHFAASLAALLRSTVEAELAGIEQTTYAAFIESRQNPGCFHLIQAAPLEGNLLLDIRPSILYPIIDRLLGGREKGASPRRPLTELELRLAGRITGLFLESLEHAWQQVAMVKPAVVQVHSDPQLVELAPPQEVVLAIGLKLSVGAVRGMIDFCMPLRSIQRIGGQLAAADWASYGNGKSSPDTVRQISEAVCSSPVGLQVRLAQTKIGTGELVSLRVGDIITTQKDVHQPVIVAVEGVPKFRASLGAYKGRKAIMIQTAIENPLDALE